MVIFGIEIVTEKGPQVGDVSRYSNALFLDLGDSYRNCSLHDN